MAEAPRPSAAGNVLTRKVGPLPVWAYVAAGLVLIVLIRKRQQAKAAATQGGYTDPYGNTYDASGNLVATGGPNLAGTGGPILGGGGGGGAAPGPSGTAGTYSTNTDWATAAINALVGHGYDPGLAANAIASYLAGGQLSAQMQAAISDAIRYAGAPPTAVVENVAPPGGGGPQQGGGLPYNGPPLGVPGGTPGPPAPAGVPSAPNRYQVGQNIPGQGSVAESLFSPVYGWLDLLTNGAIYTGGGAQPGASIGQLQYGGSYLGYLASLPASQRQAEQNLHGTFAPGGLSLLPGGGYVETNTRGETYTFGR